MNEYERQGFKSVVDHVIKCIDIWPPGSLTDAKKHAYDQLAKAGEIRPTAVSRTQNGGHRVEYMAKIPHAWQLDELKKYVGKV